MNYRILIFNDISIKGFDGEALRHHLLHVNFTTLCKQYQLDPALIAPTKNNLGVIVSKGFESPYFLVKYGSQHQRPLIVYEWDFEAEKRKNVLGSLLSEAEDKNIIGYLVETKFIVKIELDQAQLKDMGLLIAYEVARWAADRGQGIVLGLDNTWYRLNKYQAFVTATENHS